MKTFHNAEHIHSTAFTELCANDNNASLHPCAEMDSTYVYLLYFEKTGLQYFYVLFNQERNYFCCIIFDGSNEESLRL